MVNKLGAGDSLTQRIQVTPDCGLRTRSWDVAYRKLVNMVDGTRLAKDALGL